MKIIVLIMMMTQYLTATETYICYGSEENYHCEKYNGNDLVNYSYAKEYLADNIHVYESDYSDYGTEDNAEDGQQKSNAVTPSSEPSLILPFYIFPLKPNPYFQKSF